MRVSDPSVRHGSQGCRAGAFLIFFVLGVLIAGTFSILSLNLIPAISVGLFVILVTVIVGVLT